jgi:hypothetical protein
MFRFMQRFGRYRQARWRGTRPLTRGQRRNHRLNCKALEGRQLLSGYYISNESSSKVLDDPDFSRSNGAVIQQYQLNGGTNQQWNLVGLPDGNQKIVNAQSGMVLANYDHSTSNGTPIVQRPWLGSLNEQWQIFPQGNGKVEIRNAYSGKVLDNPAGSERNGTQMIQWQWHGGANQQWTLLAAGDGPALPYLIQNAATGDLAGYGVPHDFVPLADGHSLIVNMNSGEVLDDPDFSRANGTPIQEFQLNGGQNQEWIISTQGDGNVVLTNASSGLVLDEPGPGTLVQDRGSGPGLQRSGPSCRMSNGVRCPMGRSNE